MKMNALCRKSCFKRRIKISSGNNIQSNAFIFDDTAHFFTAERFAGIQHHTSALIILIQRVLVHTASFLRIASSSITNNGVENSCASDTVSHPPMVKCPFFIDIQTIRNKHRFFPFLSLLLLRLSLKLCCVCLCN